MKRATMWLLVALCRGGCASPFHAADSPGQVLSVALQAMSALKPAHADYTRHQTYHLPMDYPWPPATLGMPPHTYTMDLSGTGEMAFPDRFHYMITARLGPNFHTETELVSVQGIIYEQDGVHVDFDPLYGDERSEEHTSELQSRLHLVCRLLLEKKKNRLRLH